ncbi:hypothetical protein [Pectobacterium cacticida]
MALKGYPLQPGGRRAPSHND